MKRDRLVKSKIPGLDRLPLREYRVRFHARARAHNLRRGRTHDGQFRQRAHRVAHADLQHLPRRERAVIISRRWAARQVASGLTTRGTVRKPALSGLSQLPPKERYNAFRRLRRAARRLVAERMQ